MSNRRRRIDIARTSKREAIASMKMEKAKTLLNTKNDRVYCG